MKNLSILVVDDDLPIRKLLKIKLMREYGTVDIAEDGNAARELLHKNPYDVVITDLMMPGGIDGLGVLKIAKAVNSHTEVILITGYSTVDTAIEAMKEGANDYLEKPINFDELFLRLNKIANMQSMLRTAEDLQVAKDATEFAASETIQHLELEVHRLRKGLDAVEQILRRGEQDPAQDIREALETISEARKPD